MSSDCQILSNSALKYINMKTILYGILFIFVAPFWWMITQADSVISKLYMHISIKLMECRLRSNNENE